MKSDCIVLGAELDGLIAASYLAEQGHSVQLLSPGAGGLHYAPSGIHVLGFLPEQPARKVTDPFDSFSELGPDHPYRKLGSRRVAEALHYFADWGEKNDFPVVLHASNREMMTPTGLGLPVLGTYPCLATHEDCRGRSVAVVAFTGYRDFPHQLLAAELAARGYAIATVETPLPGQVVDSVAVARTFDRLTDPGAYFADLKARLPVEVGAILFPAVLGLNRHADVCATAQNILGARCLEVPTLPASVPGRRLENALRRYLEAKGAEIILSFRPASSSASSDGVEIIDRNGRKLRARTAIVATGGVLMGGLEIQSHGAVRETVLDLMVEQTVPLAANSIDETLEALHRTGVRTNAALNPCSRDGTLLENVFVTGQTLSGFNPAYEASADGVSIATGWWAARNTHRLLEERDHE